MNIGKGKGGKGKGKGLYIQNNMNKRITITTE